MTPLVLISGHGPRSIATAGALRKAITPRSPEHRGDGRWFVEVLCKHGLIYPKGGETLLAYAGRGVKRHLAGLGLVELHQTDGDAEVFRFPANRLSEVAAILKPRKRRTLNPYRARAIGKASQYGAQGGQEFEEATQDAD